MGNWIFILFIISTILACWVFSFVVRLASEIVARKRKRLKSERNRRSIVYALIAMALGSFGSIMSAWFAIDIALRIDEELERGGVVIAISFGLFAFALMLGIWAAIGDRSRGRLRCPRCWYDMEGIDTPQCPECGKAIKSERHLRKARRMRWPIALILFFIGVAWYGAASAKHVDQSDDYFALVPTWVLMLGWEHLPEDWIIYDNSPYEATLDVRLYENWWGYDDEDHPWVSDARVRRFGRRITKDLLRSQDARFDFRRVELINMIGDRLTLEEFYDDANEELHAEWLGTPIDVDELYRVSAMDLLHAVVAEEPTREQLRLLELSVEWYWGLRTTYGISNDWFRNRALYGSGIDESDFEEIEGRWERWERRNELAEELVRVQKQTALQPMIDEFDRDELAPLLISVDETKSEIAQMLLIESGQIRHHFHQYLRLDISDELVDLSERSFALGYVFITMQNDDQQIVLESLREMMRSDQEQAWKHAVYSFSLCHNKLLVQESDQYDACMQTAIERSLNDYSSTYNNRSTTMHGIALGLLVRHDRTGERAYPLILEELLSDAGNAPYLMLSDDPFEGIERVDAWVSNFAQLRDSTDPLVREWLINNLPVQLGTEHDALLDSIAVDFLTSPDEYDRERAIEVLQYRLADHLIGPTEHGDDDDWDDEDW